MELLKINNDIIVNPDDNIEDANVINELLKDFTLNIPMRRDNCGPINWELYTYLVNKGLDKNKLKMTFGEFKTDNLNLINMRDLTKEERRLYKNLYSDKFTNEMIIEFIKDQMPDSLDDFHYLPHQWLEYNGLILDAASKMFNKGLEKPITKQNYIKRQQTLEGTKMKFLNKDNKQLMESFSFLNGDYNQLRDDIKEALIPVCEKYGIIIKPGNVTYTANNATLKLNLSRDIDPADQFMIDYKDSYLFPYEITRDMYGKTFTAEDGKQYKLTGIKRTNRRTNRVLLIQNEKGTTYICTPEFIGINQKNANVRVNFNR